MQNFNGKVRQYLKENERKKRSRLFGVVLSVVMTVSVLASLVMPAISATEGTSVAGGDVSYNGGSYSYKDANSVTIKSYDAVGSGKDQSNDSSRMPQGIEVLQCISENNPIKVCMLHFPYSFPCKSNQKPRIVKILPRIM